MKRKQFIDRTRRLLTEMEFDHEELTGIDEDFEMTFNEWVEEIKSAQENA